MSRVLLNLTKKSRTDDLLIGGSIESCDQSAVYEDQSALLVSDVRVVSSGGECELQARVRSDASRRPFLVLYRFPRGFEGFVSAENGDPFIPALLLPAMKAHEPLEITAPVSPTLLRSVDAIQRIYRSWDPALSEVKIKAPVREKPLQRAQERSRVGLFFSCGVDSYYSLLKNVQEHPADEETITDLIVVHGFDIDFGRRNSELFRALLTNSEKVAHDLKKNALPVATNLRDFGGRFVDWRALYYGAFLASIGLALENLFERIYIASAHSQAQFAERDRRGMLEGSHPMLDPLWSTECVSFVHDGSESRRIDKTRYISQFPIVLQTLRVCIIRSYGGGPYNCGLCLKCLRTMIGLHVAGALQKCTTLPHSLDVELLSNMWISDQNARGYLEELVKSLGSSEKDLAIRSDLQQLLSGASTIRRHILGTTTYLLSVYMPFALPAWNKAQRTLARPLTRNSQ